jgi:hypothetical protein
LAGLICLGGITFVQKKEVAGQINVKTLRFVQIKRKHYEFKLDKGEFPGP